MSESQFKWLHLTDLHVGQNSLNWLWPNFKKIFTDDLERTYKEVGGFDILIFSGDLTQKGSVEEFKNLNSLLSELYESFDKWGGSPLFFSVPGNHDLERPDPESQESLLIKRWWDEPAVQKKFWSDEKSSYRKHVNKAFKNYTDWFGNIESIGIKKLPTISGIIPGDISGRATFGDLSVGFVGLNSSFLQLGDGDYVSKLDVDTRQLLAVTDDSPDAWCEKNDINFLVTHHPNGWLKQQALKIFETEIYPPGRFTAHLFGHMHEAGSNTYSLGGGQSRKNIQGAAVFGLEYFGDAGTSRQHGYSAGKIIVEKNAAEWRLWPRIANVRKDGARQLIPDYENFAIVPGSQYMSEQLLISKKEGIDGSSINVIEATSNIELSIALMPEIALSKEILERASYPLHNLDHHLVVRIAAQQASIAALSSSRIVWVCTDWGLGVYGFIYSVAIAIDKNKQAIYKVDLGNYHKREDFIDKFPANYGCSFADFCKHLSNIGPAILILDQAPSVDSLGSSRIVSDVESLGKMILDFCPQVAIFLVTRVSPADGENGYVKLGSFDEVETRSYLFSHKNSPSEIKNSRNVSEIFKLTDGVADKIERVLKSLRVIGLAELISTNVPGNKEMSNSLENIPRSLINAVASIFDALDEKSKRTSLMLKLLCILPHGETLQKIKRFDTQKPFYANHAEELLDLALIDVKNSFSIIKSSTDFGAQIKLLSSLGPVKDYVQSLISQKELDSITKKAMDLYFEKHKSTGQWRLKGREGVKISDDITTLDNAHELSLRMLVNAISLGQAPKIKTALSLAQIYCGELMSGKHYRNCAAACDANLIALRAESENFKREILSIKYLLAKSLRMLGEHTRARLLLEELKEEEWSKDFKISILLNYAFCLQSLNDKGAVAVAKQVILLSPKSNPAIQAKAIIIEIEDEDDSTAELLKLESDAKKRGAVTVRNNLILSRAESSSDITGMEILLQEVLDSSSKTNDPYNAGRASVKLAKISLKEKGTITSKNTGYLVQAYQYFYGQRFNSLFDDAHRALWEIFEANADKQNLLSLFKYSSFIWRLSGSEKNEIPYIRRLLKISKGLLGTNLLTADRDTAYFVARASQIKS